MHCPALSSERRGLLLRASCDLMLAQQLLPGVPPTGWPSTGLGDIPGLPIPCQPCPPSTCTAPAEMASAVPSLRTGRPLSFTEGATLAAHLAYLTLNLPPGHAEALSTQLPSWLVPLVPQEVAPLLVAAASYRRVEATVVALAAGQPPAPLINRLYSALRTLGGVGGWREWTVAMLGVRTQMAVCEQTMAVGPVRYGHAVTMLFLDGPESSAGAAGATAADLSDAVERHNDRRKMLKLPAVGASGVDDGEDGRPLSPTFVAQMTSLQVDFPLEDTLADLRAFLAVSELAALAVQRPPTAEAIHWSLLGSAVGGRAAALGSLAPPLPPSPTPSPLSRGHKRRRSGAAAGEAMGGDMAASRVRAATGLGSALPVGGTGGAGVEAAAAGLSRSAPQPRASEGERPAGEAATAVAPPVDRDLSDGSTTSASWRMNSDDEEELFSGSDTVSGGGRDAPKGDGQGGQLGGGHAGGHSGDAAAAARVPSRGVPGTEGPGVLGLPPATQQSTAGPHATRSNLRAHMVQSLQAASSERGRRQLETEPRVAAPVANEAAPRRRSRNPKKRLFP